MNSKGEKEKSKKLPPYEMMGTIALIDFPRYYRGQEQAAKEILKQHPNLKTAAKKAGATGGRYRIRKIKPIAGEKTTTTICKESNCQFKIDLNKAYYTNRFSHERLRVASQIKKDENILVLFSGICPFPIVIEKNTKGLPKQIIAIELNKQAHKLALENILLNKCKKIITINSDAKAELKKKKYKNWAHRILMPHPSASLEFFAQALNASKNNSLIHLYAFDKTGQNGKNILKEAKKIAKIKKIKLKLIYSRVARPFSTNLEQVVLDLKVIKE